MTAPRTAIWEPSPQELLLLRAGLWQGKRGLDSWRRWRRSAGDIDGIEPGSYRLLPLVYRNLGRLLAGDPVTARLKDIYRHSWAVNQLGLRIGRRAIDALHAAGLEVLVLKGGALMGAAYRDAGARPMGDFDIAVRPERVEDASRALEAARLVAVEEDPVGALKVRHSLAFRDAGGQEVDLHRSLQWRPGLDEEFWRGAVAAEVAGARVLALCPTDQLLHVCVHGAGWNPVQPIRWAADAFKVLEASGGQIEWDRLVAMAERGRLALPLHDAFSYLATALDAPIPTTAVGELAAQPITRAERRAHEALAQPPSSRRSAAMLWWFWERHRAEAAGDGRRPTPLGLLRHLQGFWGLDRPSRVPAHAARRLLRRRT